jgi:hypothetical protein
MNPIDALPMLDRYVREGLVHGQIVGLITV